MQSLIVDNSLEQIAVLYLAQKKALSLGPFIVALFLDAFFLGLFLMQVGSYVSALSPQKGGRIEKGLVLGLVALNIASSALAVAWVYHLFVTRYGTWAQFLDIKTLFWFYIINGLGTALVQLFFVKRVFELTRRHPRRTSPLIAILLIMIAASFACAVVIKVRGDSLGALASAEDRILLITGTVWSSCLMACDLSITGTILAILVKKKTGWKTTDKIVSRLIWFTMQSQLPPTVFAVCFLCEYQLITPTKPYVAVPFIMLQGKIYAFSLLHALNSRTSAKAIPPERPTAVRTESQDRFSNNVVNPFRKSKNGMSPDGRSPLFPHSNCITITTDTYVHNDKKDNMALDSNCSIKSPPPFDPDAFGSTTSAVGHSGADLIQASGATFTADVCAGSPHSTELDVVDMHAQRLALEVVSDEDACSSINILLSQTPQRVDAQPRTSRTL